jgi:N-terminal half of MaoC dehydratase
VSERFLAEWIATVEAGKVREFALAVRDEHWAAEPPVPPPTFPIVLSAEFVERLVVEILRLDRSRTVHGEQEYEYFRPLRTGERVRCRAFIVEDGVKTGRRGGRMRVIVSEIRFFAEADGEAIGVERMTALETAPADGGEA